jgi:hypothetical protein
MVQPITELSLFQHNLLISRIFFIGLKVTGYLHRHYYGLCFMNGAEYRELPTTDLPATNLTHPTRGLQIPSSSDAGFEPCYCIDCIEIGGQIHIVPQFFRTVIIIERHGVVVCTRLRIQKSWIRISTQNTSYTC